MKIEVEISNQSSRANSFICATAPHLILRCRRASGNLHLNKKGNQRESITQIIQPAFSVKSGILVGQGREKITLKLRVILRNLSVPVFFLSREVKAAREFKSEQHIKFIKNTKLTLVGPQHTVGAHTGPTEKSPRAYMLARRPAGFFLTRRRNINARGP